MITSDPLDTPTEQFPIPAEVNAILDEASIEGGSLAARPTATSVQLVDRVTGAIVREFKWDRAGEWASNLLRGVLSTNRTTVSPVSPVLPAA